MQTLERTTFIRAGLGEVFEFFSNPKNLAVITPPAMGFKIVDAPQRRLRAGDRIKYGIRVNGIPMTWVTLISEWEEGRRFVDLQEKGPYAYWHHTHSFQAKDGGVEMYDRVDYRLPLGLLGQIFGGWFVRRQLRGIFDFRGETILKTFGSAS